MDEISVLLFAYVIDVPFCTCSDILMLKWWVVYLLLDEVSLLIWLYILFMVLYPILLDLD